MVLSKVKQFVFLVFFAANTLIAQQATHDSVDFAKLESELESENGLSGYIHGSVPGENLAVFQWQDPKDFFIRAYFPIQGIGEELRQKLKALRRHDAISIRGSFALRGHQRHIIATDVKVANEYSYRTSLPETATAELLVKVHAVDANGFVLAVEYGDRLLPLVLRDADEAAVCKNLYRGDTLLVRVKLRTIPEHPRHAELNRELPLEKRIEVRESLVGIHGKKAERVGYLVKFPASHQVPFDIYAIESENDSGILHEYTLLNPTDEEAFRGIRTKLEALFKKHRLHAVNGRNRLIIPGLIIKATGTYNVVSQSQANPQIFLQSSEDLTVVAEPAIK